jgi:hypothetical protein
MTTGSLRRRAAALLATLVGVVGTSALTGATAHAAPGRCAPGTGVTVVVDFGGLGGGVPIGCDPSGGGDAASQVIPRAGFALAYAAGQPFVCRVDGKPGTAQESCARTPPADAYWGVFWSDGDSGWVYSSQGVASLKVPEGGSIGLRWQDGGGRDLPGAAPTAAAPEPEPEPQPQPQPQPTKPPSQPQPTMPPAQPSTPKPTPTPSPSSGSPGPDAGGGGAGEGGAAGATPSAGPGKREGKARRGPSASPSAPPSAKAEQVTPAPEETTAAVAPSSGTTGGDGDGTALYLVAGAAGVLLAGAAGTMAWRRRG